MFLSCCTVVSASNFLVSMLEAENIQVLLFCVKEYKHIIYSEFIS